MYFFLLLLSLRCAGQVNIFKVFHPCKTLWFKQVFLTNAIFANQLYIWQAHARCQVIWNVFITYMCILPCRDSEQLHRKYELACYWEVCPVRGETISASLITGDSFLTYSGVRSVLIKQDFYFLTNIDRLKKNVTLENNAKI